MDLLNVVTVSMLISGAVATNFQCNKDDIKLSCADPEGGGGKRSGPSPPPPPKNHKNIGFLKSPEKSQSYQSSIQCWAIIGTPAKRHLNGVSLEGR